MASNMHIAIKQLQVMRDKKRRGLPVDEKRLEEQEILVRILRRIYRQEKGIAGPKIKTLKNLTKRAKRRLRSDDRRSEDAETSSPSAL
jgi:hypothetical protein